MVLDLGEIISTSAESKKNAGSNKFYDIAASRGIEIRFKDLGGFMGMYKYYDVYNRFITLNQNNDVPAQTLTGYHELGHDIYDQDIAKDIPLQDFRINMKDPIELRANMFAAETQLEDSEIWGFIRKGYTIEQMAIATGTYWDYIAIKLDLLRYKGYEIKQFEYNSNFLRVAEGKRDGANYFAC